MTVHRLLPFLPLVALLVWAAVGDWRARRIPNWLTFGLTLAGLAQSLGPSATVTPLMSLLGMLSGFALNFVLWQIGARAGGDVKLMAGVGAWLGPWGVVVVTAAAALVGLVVVLAQAWWQGRTRVLLRNTAMVTVNLAYASDTGLENATDMCRSCRSVDRPLPYSVSVLAGLALLMSAGWIG